MPETNYVTDNTSFVVENTMTVTNDGFVDGYGITASVNGVDAYADVRSYELEDGRINHVPWVSLADADDSIIAEPHCRDTLDPEEAIEVALNTADWAIKDHIETDN